MSAGARAGRVIDPETEPEAEGAESPVSERGQSALDRRVFDACEAAGAFLEYWGFKAVYGRIWTLLALSSQPMSQVEIAEALQISRALVSGSIAELSRYGLVRQVEAQRQAPYEAVMDVWPAISTVLHKREWMLVESMKTALEAAIEEAELSQSRGEPLRYDISRMRALLSLSESAQGFLRLLLKLRNPASATGLGVWVGRAATILDRFRRWS